MKKLLLLSHSLFLIPYFLFSQNIGIGIANPTAKLHVAQGMVRFEGSTFAAGTALSIGGLGIVEVDAPGIPGGRFVIRGNGAVGIGTNNPFQMLHVEGSGIISEKLGIGTADIGFPLSFPGEIGDKISFWGSSGPHYGIGIADNLLQIHCNVVGSDIAFGYGTSSSFTENMRIMGNGNVGIATRDPLEKLDVAGIIRANHFKYSFPKSFLYNFSPIYFKPANSTDVVLITGVSAYIGSGTGNTLYAPLHLPHGATIQAMTVYYTDNSAGSNLTVDLVRALSPIATITSTGNPGYTSSTTISFTSPVIDNQDPYYFQATSSGGAWPGANLQISYIYIQYSISQL